MEVTEHGISQAHLSLTLGDHQWQVSDLELLRLMWLEDESLRVDLYILVLNGELGAVHFHFLVSWVLKDDLVGDALTNGARQLDVLHLRVVLNSNLERVVQVLARVLRHESALEFVHTSSQSKEVELVVLVALTCHVKRVGTSDEKSRL